MPAGAAHRYRDVIAHDLGGHHGQRLRLSRVDLAGHDRGARLVRRQFELAQAAARARRQKPYVVGDLHQARSHGVERARHLHDRVVGGDGLELVLGGPEGKPGERGDFGREARIEAGLGVEPGADGGAALGERAEPGQRGTHALDAVLHLRRVAGELLAEGKRRRVLEMGPADLDDIGEGLRFRRKRLVQMLERRQQQVMALLHGGDVHRGREGIVGRLTAVDVVVRVHRRLLAHRLAENLAGSVCDHLVGVHVALGARAGLPDDQGEVVVERARDDLACGRIDYRADLGIEQARFDVHPRRRLLDDAERPDQRWRHALAADLEVLQAALRLSTPVGARGHVDRTDRVRLAPRLRRCVGHGRTLSGCGFPLPYPSVAGRSRRPGLRPGHPISPVTSAAGVHLTGVWPVRATALSSRPHPRKPEAVP